MKVLISSDHHHKPWTAFAVPSERILGANSRLEEGLVVEDWLLQLIEEQEIYLHVRLGDLFDTKNVLDTVTFNEVFDRIAATDCKTILVKGNHDWAAGGVRSSLEPFVHLPLVTVVAAQPQFLAFGGNADGVLCFVPYTDNVVDQRRFFDYTATQRKRLKAHRDTYLFAHAGIRGAVTGSEFHIPSELDLTDIHPELYIKMFFGHYHEPQPVGDTGMYVGSLLQRTFSDVGKPRRVLILETDTGEVESIPTPGPRFFVVPIATKQAVEAIPHDGRWQGAYVKFLLGPQVTRAMVLQQLTPGAPLDCTFAPLPQHATPAPRLSAEARVLAGDSYSAWERIIDEWVSTYKSDLAKDELSRLGHHIVETTLQEEK